MATGRLLALEIGDSSIDRVEHLGGVQRACGRLSRRRFARYNRYDQHRRDPHRASAASHPSFLRYSKDKTSISSLRFKS